MSIGSEFDILRSAAAGMDAERSALDVAARNVAAAEASPDVGGFMRLIPHFALGAAAEPFDLESYEPPSDAEEDAADDSAGLPVRYLGATEQRGADVNAVTEMVAVLNAQRAFEANASVFDLGKGLAERTIDMGRVQ
ncbi:MAG: hypothetical protein M3R53_08275 [Candidatus Eremiobacteraeota bacterium]|nr:hypothetical protein [Candidatus Eremiobacteraeota bacterium]